MDSKTVSQRRRKLQETAEAAHREIKRLRTFLAIQRHRSADKERVGEALRTWGWDGLKGRMSNCAFSSYVGVSPESQLFLPPELGRQFDQANTVGLAPEFVETLIAEATLDGVKSLARFYEIMKANVLYIPAARRAF